MRAAGVAWAVWLAAGAAAGLDPWALHPKTGADCDRVIARHPRDAAAWFCFFRLAYDGQLPQSRRAAIAHLERRLAAAPGDRFARVFLGMLQQDEGWLQRAESNHAASLPALRAEGDLSAEVMGRTGWTTILCGEGRFAEAEAQLALAE